MKTKINYDNITCVNSDTGEIICELEGVTEIKNNTLTQEELKKEKYLQEHKINFCKDVKFVKLHDEIIDKLTTELSQGDFVFFFRLTKYVSYSDCVLRLTSHGNSSVMTKQMIADEFGLTTNYIGKVLNRLISKGIVGVHKTGDIGIDSKLNEAYTINPYIVFRGKDVNRTIESFYSNTEWAKFYNN